MTDLAPYLTPATSAVLVIDIQNDFVHPDGKASKLGGDSEASLAAVENINRLIVAARETGIAVVYAQIVHSPLTDRPNYRALYDQRGMARDDLLCATGSWGAELYAGMMLPQEDEAVITKYGYDAFQDTPLDAVLHSRGVTSLIMTGVVTNLCVQTTAEHGFGLGYFVTTVTDATAGDDEESHRAALRNLGAYFGRLATTDEVIEYWNAHAPEARDHPATGSKVR